MNDVALDASAYVFALTATTKQARAVRARIAAATCHAPYLIDAEVGNVLRRQVHREEISLAVADAALRALPSLVDHRYGHTGLIAERAWGLRNTITFYDGLYVALAAMLDTPLLTSDEKLQRAPGLTCRIELAA